MRYYNPWNLFLSIIFKFYSNYFAALLQYLHLLPSACLQAWIIAQKKVGILDKFDGIDNNSTKKYGEFPIRIRSVNNNIVITNYIISPLTKYTKESWLLQYASNIRKFWFMILLKLKVIILFVDHKSLFQTLVCVLLLTRNFAFLLCSIV